MIFHWGVFKIKTVVVGGALLSLKLLCFLVEEPGFRAFRWYFSESPDHDGPLWVLFSFSMGSELYGQMRWTCMMFDRRNGVWVPL